MKRTRIRFALVVSLTLALLLGGCQSSPVGGDGRPQVGEVLPPSPAPTQAPSFTERGMRLAVCTSPGSINESGRNTACYDGLLSFLSGRNGMDSLVPLQEYGGDPLSAPQAFQGLADSYDVMVFVGPVFSRLAPLAQEHPGTYFILVDAPLTDGEGNPTTLDNVCAIAYAEQECGFFAGMAAAMESEAGLVAVINDVPSPASTRYYYGFRSGVAYANGNLGTSAQVIDHPAYGGVDEDGTALGGNYTGGSDVTAYALSNSLIDEGCDILFTAAGVSDVGVINAVKGRSGVRIIGSETDRYLEGVNGPESVVLTSVTKNFSASLLKPLEDIVGGTFQGGDLTLRCADNGIGYVSANDRQQLKPETLAALEEARALMREGTIVPLAGPPEE